MNIIEILISTFIIVSIMVICAKTVTTSKLQYAQAIKNYSEKNYREYKLNINNE